MTSFPNSMKGLNTAPIGTQVDIIMRTKDRYILLVRAIESVLNQKYKDWHLFIVNDGGDKSKIDELALHLPEAIKNQVTIIHNKTNLGMEAASNVALEYAKGDFLVIHDDDDCWHVDFLETCVKFLKTDENKNYAGVITNCEVVSEAIVDDKIVEVGRSQWDQYRDFILYSDLICHNISPPIAFLMRHDAVKKAGYFNENLPVLGDWDYILRIMQIGDIGAINSNLAYYHYRLLSQSPDQYQNTVVAGINKHHLYNTIYTNALLRESINKNPELIGPLRACLLSIKSQNNEINTLKSKIDSLEKNIINEIKYKRKSLLSKLKVKIKSYYKKQFKVEKNEE